MLTNFYVWMSFQFATAPVPTSSHSVYGTYHLAQIKDAASAMNVSVGSMGTSEIEPIPAETLFRDAVSKKSLAKFRELLFTSETKQDPALGSLILVSFFYAATKGSVEILQFLIEERGIDVNAVDDGGEVFGLSTVGISLRYAECIVQGLFKWSQGCCFVSCPKEYRCDSFRPSRWLDGSA